MEITREGQESQNSLNGKLNFEQDKNRIIGRDAANNIRLLILGNNDEFVVKIAPLGLDATTADDADLIFNSNRNLFKIVDKVTIPFSVSSGAGGATNNFTASHGQNYKPLMLGSVEMSGGGNLSGISGVFMLPFLLPAISSGNIGTIAGSLSLSIVTNTEVTFNYFLMPNSSLSGVITLYVLQESAT